MSFSIGKNIKNLRIENQMTEIELSNLLACSVELIKKWENDIECPNIELLPKIAKIFNVSIDYLTTGKVDPVNNFDELLEKVTKNDDVSKLADNLIKGLDKEYHPLLYYVIKNEALNIFDYLVKNNKLKYAINNADIKTFTSDIIYLSLITNNIQNLAKIGLYDIGAIYELDDLFYNTLATDYRVNDDTINYCLEIHKRDLTVKDYLYMSNDKRHVKGLWQIIYPNILDKAIDNKNMKLVNKVFNACYDANSYAISVIKENKLNYTLFSEPLKKYEAQVTSNIPVVVISVDLLNKMLEAKMYSYLKQFNMLNKQINAKFIDFKIIELDELNNDKNSTEIDLFKAKYVKYELLNIKELLSSYKNPSDYEKQVIFNMIKAYPVSYLELVNNYLLNNNYKKIFEFAIDYELDTLASLIMKKEYDKIKPYVIELFGYYDILKDGHIKELKLKIKSLNNDASNFANENNNHMVNRCYEKIAKLLEDEKYEWFYNLNNYAHNVNRTLYKEMLEVELNCISFSVLMGLNETNIKTNSDNYKFKLYNEFLKKVGVSNE